MAYDSRCYDLASVFLEDDELPSHVTTEDKKRALAQTIQTAIEDWIEWERDHARPTAPADNE